MASYLGLPYGGEVGVEHLWIADAALCPQLPIGWAQFAEPDTLTPFYMNISNGERIWEHPQIAFLRGVVDAIHVAINIGKGSTQAGREELERRALKERTFTNPGSADLLPNLPPSPAPASPKKSRSPSRPSTANKSPSRPSTAKSR